MTTREKGLLLGGLLIIWGALMVVEDFEQEDQHYQVASPQKFPRLSSSASPTNTHDFGTNPHSHAIVLNTPRNIFAPLRDPNEPKPKVVKTLPKPVPKPRPSPKPKPPPQPSPPPRGPSPSELAAQQAQQQLRQYQFLGYLTKEGEQQIFLSNGQAIYIVKQGETIEGDIQVKSIEATAVVLSKHIKGSGETVEATLPLTKDGNKT